MIILIIVLIGLVTAIIIYNIKNEHIITQGILAAILIIAIMLLGYAWDAQNNKIIIDNSIQTGEQL